MAPPHTQYSSFFTSKPRGLCSNKGKEHFNSEQLYISTVLLEPEKMVTQDPAFWGIRKLSSFKNVFNHSSAIKSLIPPGNKKQKEMGQVN